MSEQNTKYEFVPGDEIVIAPGRTLKRIRAITAHNIKSTGLAKVSGSHLSDAANEPSEFAQGETCAGDLDVADIDRIFHGLGGKTGAEREDQQRADRAMGREMDRRGPSGSTLHG